MAPTIKDLALDYTKSGMVDTRVVAAPMVMSKSLRAEMEKSSGAKVILPLKSDDLDLGELAAEMASKFAELDAILKTLQDENVRLTKRVHDLEIFNDALTDPESGKF